MYKHECVQCSKEHGHRCPLYISFFDRFIGSILVTNCTEYIKRMNKQKCKQK